MKKLLFFSALLLNASLIHAEEVDLSELSCLNNPICKSCSQYAKFLFPIQEYSSELDAIEIEADQSEIIEKDIFHIIGNVQAKSDKYVLHADEVIFNQSDQSSLAKGNVKFQDSNWLLTSNELSAAKNEYGVTTSSKNSKYQNLKSRAHGVADFMLKEPETAYLKSATYSLCPIDNNDWFIRADSISLDLETNRGIANKATMNFLGIPIVYFPKYSWVLEGRGSGFLTPYFDLYTESSTKKRTFRSRIPYYFNLAPDRDLLLALSYMASRGILYEGKYRRLIAPSKNLVGGSFDFEARYLFQDKLSDTNRWLIDTSLELDISEKTHLNILYNTVSDGNYFKDITRGNTDLERLKSNIELTYNNPPIVENNEDEEEEKIRLAKYQDIDYDNQLSISILSETEQVVNNGGPEYTKPLEISLEREINTDKLPLQLDLNFITTNFAHETITKTTGNRTHAEVELSKTNRMGPFDLKTKANLGLTQYFLDNNNNQSRTINGYGIALSLPYKKETTLFGYEVIHKLTPRISYDFTAKKEQKDLPIFDTTDTINNLLKFNSLITGDRYSGLDRIVNENDITISLESKYVDQTIDEQLNQGDILKFEIAQRFYGDEEVVSDTVNTDFETRRNYSDTAASIELEVDEYIYNTSLQFDPKSASITKKEIGFTYKPQARKLISLSYSDDNVTESATLSAAFPLTDAIHVFAGLNKTLSSGITNKETVGIAYESCCWGARLVNFKELIADNDYNYSLGFELVFKGIGSVDASLTNHIENNIPGYKAIIAE